MNSQGRLMALWDFIHEAPGLLAGNHQPPSSPPLDPQNPQIHPQAVDNSNKVNSKVKVTLPAPIEPEPDPTTNPPAEGAHYDVGLGGSNWTTTSPRVLR